MWHHEDVDREDEHVMKMSLHAFLWGSVLSVQKGCLLTYLRNTKGFISVEQGEAHNLMIDQGCTIMS